MPKITPYLWFDGQVQEALDFYTSVFGDSAVLSVSRYPEGVPGAQAGEIMTATFRLADQEFMALNGGPHHTFSPAVSFFVTCDSQSEVDHYWDLLTDGGVEERCGWLRDRFGLSWQIVPDRLGELMGDPDPARAQRVAQALLDMVKIDIAELERAYDG